MISVIENIDCIEGMKKLPDNSIDSIISDPPYGLKFMGKKWDYNVPSVEVWKEAIRVLKPGGHLLCACGTRTQHRMAINIEDAGFEIRDVITWHYGSGFPKSLDVSKAIDKQAGAEREVIGERSMFRDGAIRRKENVGQKGAEGANFAYAHTKNLKPGGIGEIGNVPITAPSTDAAKQWNGWGTALKPATEFWTLARKPLSENTVAENVLKYGTGGINIDGCRIEYKNDADINSAGFGGLQGEATKFGQIKTGARSEINLSGRFPANVIFDEFTGKILDEQSGELSNSFRKNGIHPNLSGEDAKFKTTKEYHTNGHDDTGGASRFFYVAKASKSERGSHNSHPTVKPLELMQYLIKLITPPDGIFLDPFCGSGSTLIAGALLGFKYIGFDNDQASVNIAKQRLKNELGMFA